MKNKKILILSVFAITAIVSAFFSPAVSIGAGLLTAVMPLAYSGSNDPFVNFNERRGSLVFQPWTDVTINIHAEQNGSVYILPKSDWLLSSYRPKTPTASKFPDEYDFVPANGYLTDGTCYDIEGNKITANGDVQTLNDTYRYLFANPTTLMKIMISHSENPLQTSATLKYRYRALGVDRGFIPLSLSNQKDAYQMQDKLVKVNLYERGLNWVFGQDTSLELPIYKGDIKIALYFGASLDTTEAMENKIAVAMREATQQEAITQPVYENAQVMPANVINPLQLEQPSAMVTGPIDAATLNPTITTAPTYAQPVYVREPISVIPQNIRPQSATLRVGNILRRL